MNVSIVGKRRLYGKQISTRPNMGTNGKALYTLADVLTAVPKSNIS